MKNLKSLLLLLLFTGLLVAACSTKHDDNDIPEPVNEEEVITTLTATLTPDTGGDAVVLKKFDADGDGPETPKVTVSGNLTAGATYTGNIVLLNETVNPAENITKEVEEESNEHQFFYNVGGDLDVTTAYGNTDDNGNPLGTEFTLTTGAASTGTLTITLRHEPKKPNDGTLTDAAGETDASATFNVTVE